MDINIFTDTTEVTKDNFVDYLNAISQHPDVIHSHREWEIVDQEWKDSIKNNESDVVVLANAAKVREAKKIKDIYFDAAARLAEKAAQSVTVVEEYDEDNLGTATVIEDVEELTAAWHNLRRKGIGGSSLSEALGFHWKSHIGSMVYMDNRELDDLWIEMAVQKSTEVLKADVPDSGVLYRGHLWEEALIARWAIINNRRVGVSKATWRGIYDFQTVNMDGIILDDNGNPEGLLECKTSSREWTWGWGVPINYRAQVLWYLKASGLDYAYVLVKFDSGVFDQYLIEAHETIDGTDNTCTIEEYIDELTERWNDLEYYKNNPEELWDVYKPLVKEKKEVIDFASPGENLKKDDVQEILEDYSMIHAHKVEPYERMEERFTEVYRVDVQDESYEVDGISPVFYDYPDVDGDIIDDPYDIIPDSNLSAIDNITYEWLVKEFGKDGIINLSAIRRMHDNAPGREDFNSIDEAIEWLENI